MPELVEVEYYRRLAERALARTVIEVIAPDDWYLKRGTSAGALDAALVGNSFTVARRIGKVLLMDVSDGGVLGLRFGMGGRLMVDGDPGVRSLLYTSDAPLEKWDRFAVRFEDGGDLRIRDPRRLGGVELDPDESRLGPDAAEITPAVLRDALASSRAPLKARLMDQSRLAGVGNLIADEALWRAGLDPAREARSLSANEVRRLHRHLRKTLDDFDERGGSHTGDLMPERHREGVCPKCGTPLLRRQVGGRTTYSCPDHQV